MNQHDNVIANKSYSSALEIIKLYKYLTEKKEYVLSKQILRCGTSIGANGMKPLFAQSKKDFIHKLEIAQKEVNETLYWMRLLLDGEIINSDQFTKLNENCTELNKILSSIILTTKQKYLPTKTL